MNITLNIPDQTIADVLCTGIESGISYWCDGVRYSSRDATALDDPKDDAEMNRIMARYRQPLVGGDISFRESDTGQWLRLDAAAVQRAFEVLMTQAPSHVGDLLGDHDSITGDVFIQAAIFGEIRYG